MLDFNFKSNSILPRFKNILLFRPSSIGETFNLKCSANKNEDLKFSFDNDSFNAWDDFFTIACSPLQNYNFPTHWPECVKSCKNCLPEAPLHTGLLPVKPPNSIPIGSFGEYVCDDRSLGVMEVSKNIEIIELEAFLF